MSIRDKYNKQNKELTTETAANLLLDRNTEIQKNVSTESKNVKKATFILEMDLHTKLKMQAAVEGRNMADIVSDALKMYLDK